MYKKKTIFLISSHDYLFRTTGASYLKKISKYANVFVFSSQAGISAEDIEKLGAKGFLHFKGFKDLSRLLITIKNSSVSDEVTILSPNFNLPISFYISILCKLLFKKIHIIEYLNAATLVEFNVEKHWEYRKRVGRPLSSSPFKAFYRFFKTHLEGSSFIGKFFINTPYLLIGYPSFKKRRILVYFEAEYQCLRSKGMNPVLIRHPFESSSSSNNENKSQSEIILIAPSYLGFFKDEYEHKIIEKWSECIEAISKHYKNKIILKLHPRAKKDSAELLRTKFLDMPNIEIVDDDVEIWPLIFKSKIIITETSSIAWQTLILGSKRLFLVNIDDKLPHYMDGYVEKTHIHELENIKFFEVSANRNDKVIINRLHEVLD